MPTLFSLQQSGACQKIMGTMHTPFRQIPAYSVLREQTFARRIILFCAILLSGGNIVLPRPVLALACLLLAMVYFRGRVQTRGVHRNIAYIWLAIVVLLALRQSQAGDLLATITRIVNFAVALGLVHIYWDEGREKLMTDLATVVYPMSFQAILTVVFAFVLPGQFYLVDTPDVSFSTLAGLFNYHDVSGREVLFIRPDGFFYEPGVFQCYLNLLLFVLLQRKSGWWKMAPVMLALLTLQSTTGFIILGLQLLYFSLKGVSLHRSGLKGAARFALIVLVAGVVAPFAASNIQTKLVGEKASSANARQFDLVAGWMVIAEHPLLGIGFNHETYRDVSTSLNAGNRKLDTDDQHTGRYTSNGLIMVLYTVGIPLGVLYLLGMMRQDLMPDRLIFAAIVFLALSTESLVFTPFFALFGLRGLCYKTRARRAWVRAAQVPQLVRKDIPSRLPANRFAAAWRTAPARPEKGGRP